MWKEKRSVQGQKECPCCGPVRYLWISGSSDSKSSVKRYGGLLTSTSTRPQFPISHSASVAKGTETALTLHTFFSSDTFEFPSICVMCTMYIRVYIGVCQVLFLMNEFQCTARIHWEVFLRSLQVPEVSRHSLETTDEVSHWG